jgi:2-keto-4-pentenoate hydratase/2-oxohepta-3-ene-1,7-dioic acid hydratase in catechol pathway
VGGAILSPVGKVETHHEVELGVVIGERATRVREEDAMRYVRGYFLALDMTDRQAQNEAKAKGLPWAGCDAMGSARGEGGREGGRRCQSEEQRDLCM